MKKNLLSLGVLLVLACSCKTNNGRTSDKTVSDSTQVYLNETAIKVRDLVRKDIVIAHRGSEFWTPEETEPAFRFARNLGADYLEFDIQLTKDSMLVAFHDSKPARTTNVATVFPERADGEINDFTLSELRMLDAGSWFNEAYPEQARPLYTGQQVLTLEDVIMIAEGYRIKRNNGVPELDESGGFIYEKDPLDNGNRPGVYIETKSPKDGVEKILTAELTRLGWNIEKNPKKEKPEKGKVDIAATGARVILQSFSKKSIVKLDKYMPGVPKCLLLWKPNMGEDVYAELKKAIDFAVENNAEIMGPSIAGAPNDYGELCGDSMVAIYHAAGLLVHPYTFDTMEQLGKYGKMVDGVYTNRADLALESYGRLKGMTAGECLVGLGY